MFFGFKKKHFVLLFAIISACGCPKISRPNVINPTIDRSECIYTDLGACVISNGQDVDLDSIDVQISKVESCLSEWFKSKPALHRSPFWKPPKRSCYTIYAIKDWYWSCGTDSSGKPYQLFGHAPQKACNSKGFTEDPDCPCGWRGALGDGEILATGPDMRFLSPVIVEWLTGYPASDLWADQELSKCASIQPEGF